MALFQSKKKVKGGGRGGRRTNPACLLKADQGENDPYLLGDDRMAMTHQQEMLQRQMWTYVAAH